MLLCDVGALRSSVASDDVLRCTSRWAPCGCPVRLHSRAGRLLASRLTRAVSLLWPQGAALLQPQPAALVAALPQGVLLLDHGPHAVDEAAVGADGDPLAAPPAVAAPGGVESRRAGPVRGPEEGVEAAAGGGGGWLCGKKAGTVRGGPLRTWAVRRRGDHL